MSIESNTPPHELCQRDSYLFTRRKFLTSTAAALAGVALQTVLPVTSETQTEEVMREERYLLPASQLSGVGETVTKSNRDLMNTQNEDAPDPKGFVQDKALAYANTAAEAVGFAIANAYAMDKAHKLGVPMQSSALSTVHSPDAQQLKAKLREVVFSSLVTAPLVEEGLFRFIPGKFFTRTKEGPAWKMGILTSLFFASIHNFYNDEKKKLRFATDRIPLSQFNSGMFFWNVMRRKGIDHAVVAHSSSNAFVLAYMHRIASQMEREQTKEVSDASQC